MYICALKQTFLYLISGVKRMNLNPVINNPFKTYLLVVRHFEIETPQQTLKSDDKRDFYIHSESHMITFFASFRHKM